MQHLRRCTCAEGNAGLGVEALLPGWISKQMLQGGKWVLWAKMDKSCKGLSGVASLRFP